MKKIFTILFFALLSLSNAYAGATFTSAHTGTWTTASTWTKVGVDADGIPDSDDNVTIKAGHKITFGATLQNFAKTLVISATGTLVTNSKALGMYGNLTNNGTISGTFYYFRVLAPCVLTSATPITNTGVWYIYSNLTISAGTTINKPNSISLSGGTVNNLGSVILSSGTISYSGASSWTNGVNSFLQVTAPFTGTITLNASATSNTVVCNTGCTNVPGATYYNLKLASASTATKTATGNITVLNDFAMTGGNSNFNLNNRNLTIGGNWLNSSNKTILNQGTITFNGSGTQTITRTANEVFTKLAIAGTGTVQLAKSINVTQSITMTSGTLDPTSSFTVNVLGNFINNGGSIAQQGMINFNGSVAQTISGSATAGFYNVNSANSNASGVSVTSNIKINNVITVSSGKFGTSGAGVVRIPATGPTTYGRIGVVAGTLTGTGWLVEGYIDGPAPKGWQYLSSPISGDLLADWDNDTRFYMSGVGGNDGMAGSFKSVRTYNEVTGAYANVTTTTTVLTPGKGFMLWMADNNTTGLTAPLIYNSIGLPNSKNISFPVTAGGAGSGYNLVGNPYACPITYSAVVAASGNLDPTFVILTESGSYVADPNGGIISPNQGFMCVATSGGSIQFTEACKDIVSLPNVLRTAPKSNLLTINVYNNINGLGGQTSIEFSENASDNFERTKDLTFLASPYEDADNIWSSSVDNTSLLKNVLQSSSDDKTVPLTVKSGVYGAHHLSIKGLSNLNTYNSVWLEDLSTGKKTDLTKEQNYDFNADDIGKEYKFLIHFSNKKASPSNETSVIATTNLLNENTSVYNTPSNVVVKFDMQESTPVKISVYSLTGQEVMPPMNLNVTNDRIALPLQKENGLYLLIIQSKDQQISRKIIY